ncbi:MAG: hypothetical protein Q8922_03695 [Bacteroidota bacterium]|nr:hypothetical protein [Bacteroidota bacterium]MDP4233396.1 hypothetical protein [Bacteroidota bacterium]MDP4242262.1 hypothetical protein [Bacteroidota bacterium]MDP4287018.1 hypothetical protein [Bacteroidota bacterium]
MAICLLLLASSTRAQDRLRVQRIEYVIGSSLAFSLLDYVGFNLDVRQLHNIAWVYHGIQSVAQAAITYFLYKTCGLSSAIAFNLIWWTWGDDLGYYGWAYALNPPSHGSWENRVYNGLQSHQISWAYWTPIGLLRPRSALIARDALVAQAIVGLSVSMAILW